MGHSLGTAPTVHLANNPNYYNVAGLVLISPLASGMSLLLGGEELKKKNPKDVFNNKDIIGRIISPIFLIHGRKDSTFDIQKRIGSIVSTGEDNMTDIPLMSKTYRCAECKDYTVSSTSDVASRLDDMFKES